MSKRSTNAIVVTGVIKAFGDLNVLKGVDLTVRPGEIFTLLGENGAGKSTLINLLTGLSQPTSGYVQVLGLDPQKAGDRLRRQISLNAQTMTLDEEFTGTANLRLIAQLRGLKNPQQAIDGVAKRLALGDFLARKVKTYSGGMKRRLDLAMSLLGDPDLLFLDEPTTGVDPKNRLALWQLIRELRDSGKTVFLTTQYLDEADALSDRIAFIHDGVIVKVGTPAEIKHQVQAQYRLGVAPEAVAAAQVALHAAGIEGTFDEASVPLPAVVANRGLAAVVAAGITPVSFEAAQLSLEQVFMQVTKEDDHVRN